jgi:hypothetical protein
MTCESINNDQEECGKPAVALIQPLHDDDRWPCCADCLAEWQVQFPETVVEMLQADDPEPFIVPRSEE